MSVAHRGAFLSRREGTSPPNHPRSASGLTVCTTHGPPGCVTPPHGPLCSEAWAPRPPRTGPAPPARALKPGASAQRRRRRDPSGASADVPAEGLRRPSWVGITNPQDCGARTGRRHGPGVIRGIAAPRRPANKGAPRCRPALWPSYQGPSHRPALGTGQKRLDRSHVPVHCDPNQTRSRPIPDPASTCPMASPPTDT